MKSLLHFIYLSTHPCRDPLNSFISLLLQEKFVRIARREPEPCTRSTTQTSHWSSSKFQPRSDHTRAQSDPHYLPAHQIITSCIPLFFPSFPLSFFPSHISPNPQSYHSDFQTLTSFPIPIPLNRTTLPYPSSTLQF